MSVEIYPLFLFLHGSVFRFLFQTTWNRSSNYENIAKVMFCDLFLIMWWTFDNIKHLTIYTQEERKFHFSYDIWHFMCYVGLTCPQDHWLFDSTRCVVSLSFLFSDSLYSGNINSWRSYYGNIFLLAWYVSCACELFSVNLIVFSINNFH